jgi:O6-methylguanine-DNA--protein-cysteine methyltransferase
MDVEEYVEEEEEEEEEPGGNDGEEENVEAEAEVDVEAADRFFRDTSPSSSQRLDITKKKQRRMWEELCGVCVFVCDCVGGAL